MNNANIKKSLLERVRFFLERHREDYYGDYIILDTLCGSSVDPVPFAQRNQLDFKPVSEGDCWGDPWHSAWFHLKGSVPDAWSGRELVLRINFSGESLLFDKNGVPVSAFSAGSIFNPFYVKEDYICGTAKGGENLEFIIEAAANTLFGLYLDPFPAMDTKTPQGKFDAVVSKIRLGIFLRDVWEFILDVEVLYNVLVSLPENDYRYNQIIYALDNALSFYGNNPDRAAAADDILQPVMKRPAVESALTTYAVGHAHIDVGWLWPVRESIRKVARTFSNQLRLMETYPDYIFGASQPQLYQFAKEYYPELYEQIKEQVKAGRWECQGGMWVEADCNIISGESMVRQFLHGKNFYMDEFGVDVRNLWLPDVFGYSAAMPQIIKKSGCDFFLTQKLSWCRINNFPHDTFMWEGIDGTSVLAHFPPEQNYNSPLMPDVLRYAQNNFKENAFLDKFITLFGVGDGGGGPSIRYIETKKRVENFEYTPKVVFSKAEDFFDKLAKDADKVTRWVGELYLEFHRGTLTTQSRTKRGNRKNEQLLAAVEYILSHLPLADYPQEEMDKNWKKLLINQFHDIIPGSSISKVYDVTEKEYAGITQSCLQLADAAAAELFAKDENSLVLVNTLSVPFRGTVVLPESFNGCALCDEQGNAVEVQVEDGKTVAAVVIPGGTFLTLRKDGAAQCAETGTSPVLENDLIRYEFSADGKLVSAFDKELQREFVAEAANVLSVYCDEPNEYDAWDIDIFYQNSVMEELAAESFTSISGNARSMIVFNYSFGASTAVQQVVLEKNSKRLDFVTHCDWHENRRMLRVSFPVQVFANEATFDIQYGNIKRPTHNNTSWEVAKFEVVGHRYADISELRFGAALLNDCKYGYKVKDNVLDLNLLRSPKYPDFEADMGEHDFTYSFYPHAGSAMDSGLLEEAAALNRSPLVFAGYSAAETLPVCRMISDSVNLEVVKKAEKEDCLVVRLVEMRGRHSCGTLDFGGRKVALAETDLMEWKDSEPFAAVDGKADIELAPFEIKTFKVRCGL